MALKYYFEFTDVEEILHRCEIYDADFVGDSTEVNGSVSLNKAKVDDILDSVRGGGLIVVLDADSDLTFDDLYSEEERTFSVKYIRDGVELFYGWLSPEGLFEDFVQDRWQISLNCTDGVGFLKNLSYVTNEGLNFVGKQSGLEIIVNCLKRTNLEQDIYTSTNIIYEGLSISVNPLANVYFNSDRFVKDDGDTIMNCDEVLRSVLEDFSMCITQREGAWYLYSPNHMYNIIATQVFYAYDYNGDALDPTTVTIDFNQDLGSQINNFYPYHSGSNQQISTKSSLGAYRINYKYGLVKSFVSNNYLVSNSDTDIPDYTIIDDTYLSFPTDRLGIYVETNNTSLEVLQITDTISILQDSRVKLKFNTLGIGVFASAQYYGASFEVKLIGTSNTYYLKLKELISGEFTQNRVFSASWETTYSTLTSGSFVSGGELFEDRPTYESEVLPEDGDIEVRILTSVIGSGAPGGTPDGDVFIKELSFSPIINEGNLKGENHTFQRTNKPSSKIKDIKTVYTGDNTSDIYEGAIYKSDETTPTQNWLRIGYAESKPLLRIMGENRMRMSSRPLKEFKGSVYGYFPYLSVVTIDNVSGLFMAIEYVYSALENKVEVTFKEILNLELSDISYQLDLDYGEVVQPTIRG